jgi:hypothetical protein
VNFNDKRRNHSKTVEGKEGKPFDAEKVQVPKPLKSAHCKSTEFAEFVSTGRRLFLFLQGDPLTGARTARIRQMGSRSRKRRR